MKTEPKHTFKKGFATASKRTMKKLTAINYKKEENAPKMIMKNDCYT